MKKFQNGLYSAIVLSEVSHVFCCVLPTVFSVLSLLVGVGMVTAVPLWLQNVHGALHQWEVPLIAFSGFIVALGWAIHIYSEKADCHSTGCGHGPCATKKNKAQRILKIATILFLANISIYLTFHQGMGAFVDVPPAEMHETHAH